ANGTADGSALAFANANQHSFPLDTATAGAKSATFTSTVDAALSPQVPGGPQTLSASYMVLDHATASFAAQEAQSTLTLDFGAFTAGSGLHQLAYGISNLLATAGFTAPLDFLDYVNDGMASPLDAHLTTFDHLAAGATANYMASFDASSVGTY